MSLRQAAVQNVIQACYASLNALQFLLSRGNSG
jgi:hypothetical protein